MYRCKNACGTDFKKTQTQLRMKIALELQLYKSQYNLSGKEQDIKTADLLIN